MYYFFTELIIRTLESTTEMVRPGTSQGSCCVPCIIYWKSEGEVQMIRKQANGSTTVSTVNWSHSQLTTL